MWKRKSNNLAHLGAETIFQKHAAAEYAAVHAGLTWEEAKRRFGQFGPNEVVSRKTLSTLGEFLIKFKNPLIIILMFAAGLAAFFGDNAGAIIIVMMILASVILDFVNTVKSERAAEALKARVLTTATVTRDGRPQEIPLREIVPGDVVLLEPGDMIPADGEVASAKDLFINQSVLTGESFPAEKDIGGKVLMGSSVVTGLGAMTVDKTGRATEFYKIAASLTGPEAATDFDESMKKFSALIMKLILVLVIFVFFVNAILKHEYLNSFLFALALAVGLTPELLPMIIALNLSKGSVRLSHRGIIVKKLSALNSFGSMDVLCTDKTGTLTEDRITLVKYIDTEGKDSERVLLRAYLSSFFESGYKNPLDEAVKAFRHIDVSDYKKIDEIPFDFTRKRSSVVVESSEARLLIAKGAPDELLAESVAAGESSKLLTTEKRHQIEERYQQLSRDGFRVLAVAVKNIKDKKQVYTKEDEDKLIFLGFIAFLDPAKKSVAETLDLLERYGLEIKIITGDDELVTQRIASDIKLPIKGMLVGSEIIKLTDEELKQVVEKTTIFARILPDQKERLIKFIQSNGHVVGYLGDGINDASPLKAADVGISVNNAVDVAKESADLILLNKSLHVLVEGVVEGRKTFVNTLKYMMMSLSSNFGNMFSVAAASFVLPFLPMLPTQILLNNLLYDMSQLGIPFDNADRAELERPRKLSIHFIRRFMFIFGPISSVFDMLTFVVLYYLLHLNASAFQTGWFIESLATQILVIFIIRTKRLPFIESRPSRYIVISAMGMVLLGIYLAFSNLGGYFGFSPISILASLSIGLIVFFYLISVEIVKRWFYRQAATIKLE